MLAAAGRARGADLAADRAEVPHGGGGAATRDAGARQKAWLFLLRLTDSGRDFAWIYERQDHVGLLEGHVRTFAHVEGVPAQLAYDNLRPAVTPILVGGKRALTPPFAALAAHYASESASKTTAERTSSPGPPERNVRRPLDRFQRGRCHLART